jgi:hypothetical protein
MQRCAEVAALGILGLFMGAVSGKAQQDTAPPSHSFRQLLENAWWTGPMLAPSAATLPKGHILIEPYLYDVTVQGNYDSSGARHSAPHANGFGSLTYVNYGLANRLTVGLIPTFGYNEVSHGPSGAGIGAGDLTVQAQFRLTEFREHRWVPTTSVAVQETLPTGKYDRLGDRTSDGLGSGAYTTAIAFYSQTYFWLRNGRILRTRFNVLPAFSRSAELEDASVYGTQEGFRGRAKPGSSVFVDAAWEYSVSRHWVLALDATYRYQSNTPVIGYSIGDPNRPILVNSGTSEAFGLAPAIEYNWTRRLGVLLGTRLIPAGQNANATITPALAINFVR